MKGYVSIEWLEEECKRNAYGRKAYICGNCGKDGILEFGEVGLVSVKYLLSAAKKKSKR